MRHLEAYSKPMGWWAATLALVVLAAVGTASAGDRGEASAFLGVSTVEETEHSEGGARVMHLVEGSAAEAAGVREGDVIIELDGDPVRGPAGLRERIRDHRVGDRVSVTVLRDGRETTIDVELGARPERRYRVHGLGELTDPERWEQFGEQMGELGERLGEHLGDLEHWKGWSVAPGRPRLGVQLIEATPELRSHLGGTEDAGLLVSKVLADTPAERAGVRVGDLIVAVDGEPVADVGDLVRALGERAGRSFGLEVVRDRVRQTLTVDLPDDEERGVRGPRAGLRLPPAPPHAPVAPARPPVAAATAAAAPPAPLPAVPLGPPPAPPAPRFRGLAPPPPPADRTV